MKVKNLIKELKEYNQEADITLPCSEDIVISFICEDGATERTTKQLFIEASDKYEV